MSQSAFCPSFIPFHSIWVGRVIMGMEVPSWLFSIVRALLNAARISATVLMPPDHGISAVGSVGYERAWFRGGVSWIVPAKAVLLLTGVPLMLKAVTFCRGRIMNKSSRPNFAIECRSLARVFI